MVLKIVRLFSLMALKSKFAYGIFHNRKGGDEMKTYSANWPKWENIRWILKSPGCEKLFSAETYNHMQALYDTMKEACIYEIDFKANRSIMLYSK